LRGIELIELGAFREAVPVLELSAANGNYNDRIKRACKILASRGLLQGQPVPEISGY
jgi:hypothetical protein